MSIRLYNKQGLIYLNAVKALQFFLEAWLCLLLVSGCGQDSSSTDSAPICPMDPLSGCQDPPPISGDPRYGQAGHVLIQDSGCSSEDGRLDCLWIGIDDPAEMDKIVNRGNTIGSIRGEIIADPSMPHGFYLDPATTFFWDGGLIDVVVTSIDRTEADPAFYETGPWAPYHFWAFNLKIVGPP